MVWKISESPGWESQSVRDARRLLWHLHVFDSVVCPSANATYRPDAVHRRMIDKEVRVNSLRRADRDIRKCSCIACTTNAKELVSIFTSSSSPRSFTIDLPKCCSTSSLIATIRPSVRKTKTNSPLLTRTGISRTSSISPEDEDDARDEPTRSPMTYECISCHWDVSLWSVEHLSDLRFHFYSFVLLCEWRRVRQRDELVSLDKVG